MVNQEGIRKTKKNKEKTRKQMYPKTTLVEETSQGIRGESLDIPFGAASDPSGGPRRRSDRPLFKRCTRCSKERRKTDTLPNHLHSTKYSHQINVSLW